MTGINLHLDMGIALSKQSVVPICHLIESLKSITVILSAKMSYVALNHATFTHHLALSMVLLVHPIKVRLLNNKSLTNAEQTNDGD